MQTRLDGKKLSKELKLRENLLYLYSDMKIKVDRLNQRKKEIITSYNTNASKIYAELEKLTKKKFMRTGIKFRGN